ncbi:MAG: 16S rRNA (cytidine(1402)-2'-O)-methyltransferase [Polyangiales bacterium]
MGTLFVVSTPIGNLDDLTIRAQKTLAECDAVLAEDTRRTRQLLSHLGLSKPLRTLNAHAHASLVDAIARELVDDDKRYALVSDAGTPLVSDPGAELVRAVIAAGGTVVPIPGASAVLTALAGSGLATNAFRFVGFLPRSGSERGDALAKIVDTSEAVVLFEAGNRARETISDLAARMPARACAIGRELTKLHEEFLRGSLEELAASIDEDLRGEVTIVLGAHVVARSSLIDELRLCARIDEELAKGLHAKEVADIVAAWSGLPRREIYARVVARKSNRA